MYLKLFHGRHNPDENLEDWGFNGPVFGPLPYVHGTYNSHLKFETPEGEDGELRFDGDLVYYDGAYYGDWSAFDGPIPDSLKHLWQKYDPKKAR